MNQLNSKNKIFWSVCLVLFIALCAAYSNHFDNVFHFDDTHTIVGNQYIRDISNLPKFFTDVKYYGTMPTNQGYNPILVSLNAIDYWLAGSLDVRYFHASIFISYLFLLFLLYVMVRNIYVISSGEGTDAMKLFVLLAIGYFGLHASNAETINYVIMRSDSFSTLCIVASFVLYQNKELRKYYLYLLTMLIGIGTKETAVMFGPMLFIYAYLFEREGNFLNLNKRVELVKLNAAFVQAMPAILLGFGTFYLIRTQFIDANHQVLGTGSAYGIYRYFITQWVIISHYLGNFILPLDLSADPDFKLYWSVINRKVLFSLVLLLSLVGLALFTSTKKKYRPISFGIFWFFLALAPTSSFHPLGQVANDHRTFFPYIGLIISLFWWFYLIYTQFRSRLEAIPYFKPGLISVIALIYGMQVYGTYQRNEVWDSEESLWYDVTKKSPNNGRGLMNYALTLMQRGEYDETLIYFERAMQLMPRYSYLHINMGILKDAMGKSEESEQYYKNALTYDPYNSEAYFYYGKWLNAKNRKDEAIKLLEKGHQISPGHIRIERFLKKLKSGDLQTVQDPKELMEKIRENPTADDYINLSLAQYNLGQYEECIQSCLLAIELKPDNADAYNNICSAYNKLKQPEKAIKACEKAIEINPDFERAKNNLQWSKDLMKTK